MPSLRSSGKILGNPTSIRQLAQEYHLSSPISLQELIEALGVHGSPEIPFRYGTHNLSFRNFTEGIPDWGTFQDTFGAAEVWHEQVDPIFGHPILTAAFYAFYHYFLKGEANGGLATGFCTVPSPSCSLTGRSESCCNTVARFCGTASGILPPQRLSYAPAFQAQLES